MVQLFCRRAPELRAVHIDPEAIRARRQGDGNLAIGIGHFAISSVGCAIEGIHGLAGQRRTRGIRNRHLDGGAYNGLYVFHGLGNVAIGIVGITISCQVCPACGMIQLSSGARQHRRYNPS